MNRFISFFLCLCLVFCSVPLVVCANDNTYSTPWDDKTGMEKLNTVLEALNKTVGTVLVDHDYSKAYDIMLDFADHVDGNFSVSGDSADDKAQSILDMLNDKFSVVNQNEKQQIRLTGALLKDYKSFMKEYIKKQNLQNYYTVPIPCLKSGTLKASYLAYSRDYKVVSDFLKEYDYVFYAYSSNLSSIIVSPFNKDDIFFIYNQNSNFNYEQFTAYSVKSESYHPYNYYVHTWDDDFSIPSTDLTSADWTKVTVKDRMDGTLQGYSLISYTDYNNRAGYQQYFNLKFLASKDIDYIRVYTSVQKWQDSISGTETRKVYYTSNYYNTTYNDTNIDIETLYKYMDNIQSILEKLKIEERENNYDEDALTRRLDALINAIWSSTGDISDDTGTLVDQNNKALKWYEKIYNKLCDIKGSLADDTISEPWNKEVTNLVKNTDNDATMNNFFTSLSLTFSPVGESMKTKFPFSMPWDVYAVIVLLCAEPQTPKYTLPFKFDTFGIDTELVVDCSHLSFLATVSRTMLTLLYILGLIRLTTKIIGKGDD